MLARRMLAVLHPLPLTWETQIEPEAPSFSLANLSHLQPFERMNQSMGGFILCSALPLLLCHSAFQANTQMIFFIKRKKTISSRESIYKVYILYVTWYDYTHIYIHLTPMNGEMGRDLFLFLFLIVMFIQEMERGRQERAHICWFILQMPTVARTMCGRS